MNLRCEEVDELLAAYALDALEADERLAMLEHLADCRHHDDELADFRDVTAKLALAPDDLMPPAGLRNRLLETFDAEVGGDITPASQPTMLTPRSQPSPWFKRAGFAYAIAAALLLMVGGLSAWNLSLRDSAEQQSVMVKDVQQDGMRLRLVYQADDASAEFSIDLPQLPPGRTYQAWKITPAGPVSLGLLNNQTGTSLSADLTDATAVAVSAEPAGGSPAPTSTPVMVAPLDWK